MLNTSSALLYLIGGIILVPIIVLLIVKKSQKYLLSLFQNTSFEMMEKNQRSFIDLAKTVLDSYQEKAKGQFEVKHEQISSLIKPVHQTLEKMDHFQRELEKQRETAYVSLHKQVENLITSENLLRSQTANLTQALRSPNVRGAWGQIHLKRVVELSGMLNHCDFYEQKSRVNDAGTYRPDLVIHLPGDRHIVIDAKTPIEAYLQASEASDEINKKQKLKDHAKHVKKHMKDLSAKEYWKQFSSLEYVILFLPAEAFFSSAISEDPTLLEVGAKQNIIIATPTTLIAILRAVAYSWKQESISKSAKEIAKIGQELYERMMITSNHFSKLGKSLSQSVDTYNQAIASFETRVLVSAKKLKEMGMISTKESHELEEVTKTTRSLKHEKILPEGMIDGKN